ncbi:MAG: peptidoglycan peptidase [Alphaproteobacteria bacterium]|nr:peptidoglycan peptidase [Alphaproteobacteria bacterium]
MTAADADIKNRRRKILAAVFIVPLLVLAGLTLWGYLSWATPAVLPPLRDGDIVFNTSRARQTLAVGIATGSPLTHVGFIRHKNGVPYVMEASADTRETPLGAWIETGFAGRLLVLRLPDVPSAKSAAAIRWAEKNFGRPYDIFFAPGHDAFYCSEFVEAAFAAAGLQLGKTETLAQLHLTSAPVRALIGERWQRHPRCKGGQAKGADDCLSKIGALDIITPVSIARDAALVRVYSNYLFW